MAQSQSSFVQAILNSVRLFAVVPAFVLCGWQLSNAQDNSALVQPSAERPANAVIEIPEEPKTVDPATLLPEFVAKPVTVSFDGKPLRTVFTWLQQEQSINLVVDYKALVQAKVLETEPVRERSNDSPLYLLLNRLSSMGLAWYVRENSLYITSVSEQQKIASTVAYNLGDFFDAGYASDDLLRTITRASAVGNEPGAVLLLGDIAFLRQTENTHLEIAGLLKALRTHGRRTLTLDSPRHSELRLALNKPISVDFQETPLVFAIQTLSEQAQIDIRLDRQVRERTPMTLKLADQKLAAVLRSMLSHLDLTWTLHDEVLWITTYATANSFRKTAVYDVRDLCRDQNESKALKEALMKQVYSLEGSGSVMETPMPGVLVVRSNEAMLDEILQLLENYRIALRASKVRKVPAVDPDEVVTGYYRLPRPMARDLKAKLPRMILPDTWRTNDRPDAPGSIEEISIDAKGGTAANPPNQAGPLLSENQVLVIRQTRAAHRLIGKLIQTLTDSGKIDANAAAETGVKTPVQSINFGSSLVPQP